ncbi:chlorite dismutase [mine drainage metagenome]|uniref:Chlorite dismutase n=1 Tax=mine drainage metagenome TaxID=410659 RepID=T1BE22_9ZZZZ
MTEPAAEGDSEPRDFVKYTLLHLSPEWRRRATHLRHRGSAQLERVLESPPAGAIVRTFSLVGTKADVEMLLWIISPDLDRIQQWHARLFGTEMGGYLETRYSYLGMARRSEYLGEHAHAGQEGGSSQRRPADLPYLFLYPFIKRRDWYGLPFEERRRIMGEHFRIGHKYPSVLIHTAYSFGLDDMEFILSFEAESPGEFLDLVSDLRPTEASRYTQLETPIFTALRVRPKRMIELAEGIP